MPSFKFCHDSSLNVTKVFTNLSKATKYYRFWQRLTVFSSLTKIVFQSQGQLMRSSRKI